MPQHLKETAAGLLETVNISREQFKNIDELAWSEKQPGKWSRKEILGHLVDSVANNHLRFVRAQLVERDFIGVGYEQDHFVACQHYQEVHTEMLIELWYCYNLHLAHVISHIDPLKLDVSCHIGNYPPMPLSFVVTDYLTHLKHHLAQILI